jgi:hypothetical protein
MCVFDLVRYRKIPLFRLVFFLTSLIGSAFLLLAPGNFIRFKNDGQMSRSFKSIVASNLYQMAGNYLDLSSNFYFLLLLLCFVCLVSRLLHKADKIPKGVSIAAYLLSPSFFLLAFFFKRGGSIIDPYIIGTTAIFYLHIAFFVYLTIKWLIDINNRYLTAFFLGALVSQAAMLTYAPFISDRMVIVFYFAMFALFVHAFGELQDTMPPQAITCCLLALLLISTAKMAFLTYDYMAFYPTHKYNDAAMRQAAEQLKAGHEVEAIYLIPADEDVFGSPERGIAYTVFEYYGLPYYEERIKYL